LKIETKNTNRRKIKINKWTNTVLKYNLAIYAHYNCWFYFILDLTFLLFRRILLCWFSCQDLDKNWSNKVGSYLCFSYWLHSLEDRMFDCERGSTYLLSHLLVITNKYPCVGYHWLITYNIVHIFQFFPSIIKIFK